jgi:hypothetical protein
MKLALARRPFWLALAASLLLHLAVLIAPGWERSEAADEREAAPLAATLAVPIRTAPAPQAARTAPPRKPRPRPPAAPPPAPDMPVASVPGEAAQSAAAPAPAEPAVAEPEPSVAASTTAESPGAVPPAPTIFPYAEVWPQRGRIVFQVTRGEGGFIVGRSEHRWEHDGKSYTLRALTETTGLAALFRPAQVVQESRGAFVAAGLQPQEFRNERSGKPVDSVRFDAAERRVYFGAGQGAAFGDAAQDMLSLFYQAGALALDVERHALKVATGRKLADYVVTVGAATTLDTPLGPRGVRHLKIAPARGGELDDTTEIWLDAALRLPLKIRYRDRKGEVFDQVVLEIQTERSQ